VGKLERQRGKKKPKGKLWERGAAACVKENGVGAACVKENGWGFVLLAGKGEENGGTDWKMKGNGAPVGVVQRL